MRDLLTATLIAKDEEANIEPCFACWWDHVDEVVLVDTGSQDGTVKAARRFARQRGEPEKLVLGKFDWCDDFAAARNHADELASGDWLLWSDLDDRIVGAKYLRPLIRNASEDEGGYAATCFYDTATERQSVLPRLVRRDGVGPWEGPVWEERRPLSPIQIVDSEYLYSRHERSEFDSSSKRNLRLYRRWEAIDPEHPRLRLMLAELARRDGDWCEVRRQLRAPSRCRNHADLTALFWEQMAGVIAARFDPDAWAYIYDEERSKPTAAAGRLIDAFRQGLVASYARGEAA